MLQGYPADIDKLQRFSAQGGTIMIKRQNINFWLRLWILTVSIILLSSAGQAQSIETIIPADSFLYLKLTKHSRLSEGN